MLSRRQAFRLGLIAAPAAALAASPAAFAFRIVEEEATPRVQALIGACETRNAHERMVAQFLAELDGEAGTGDAAAIDRVREMTCPFCGCGLAATRPERDAAPRF
jgi:hypothetical protein